MRGATLLGTSAAVAAAAVVGGLAARPEASNWYGRLRKPPFQPPKQAFPFAWTALYTDVAITSAATLDTLTDAGRVHAARRFRTALAVNLVLNAAWTWIFFDRHRTGAAVVTAGALTLSGADLARRAASARSGYGVALLPYPLWCAFATVLSAEIWRRNR